MRFSTSIMGGDDECDLEGKIIDVCEVDHRKFMINPNIFTKEIFEKNFDRIIEKIDEYANLRNKFPIAYKVLGRFVLLTGIDISEEIRDLIIKATNWSYEKDIWIGKENIAESKRNLKELRDKIIRYKPGIPDPLKADLRSPCSLREYESLFNSLSRRN